MESVTKPKRRKLTDAEKQARRWRQSEIRRQPLDPNQRYSVAEYVIYRRSGRKAAYDDFNSGRVKTIRDGRRRFVLGSEIIRISAVGDPQVAS